MAKGLGKGIGALFVGLESMEEAATDEAVQEMEIKRLRPNPYQPRKIFHKEAIEELKQSILEHGIIQPLIVRKSIKGYEIVVGERRFRAATEAELKTVPVVIRNFNEQQMMEIALLENLQREDLTPIEEAAAYEALISHLNITQEELAKRVGKSRPHVANHLRLLSLPLHIQDFVSEGTLSMGHGRALLGLKKKEKIDIVAQKIIDEQLNVRQVEQLIQLLNENVPHETKQKKKKEQSVFFKQSESFLRERFGTSVSIKSGGKKGKIEIEFLSNEDLERILEMLEIRVEE